MSTTGNSESRKPLDTGEITSGRILKTIDPPDHVKTQIVVFLFEIPQDKASLIVRMAQEDVEPPEDTPTGMSNLYVIRLDKAVLERPKFRKMNPGYRYRWWRPCMVRGRQRT